FAKIRAYLPLESKMYYFVCIYFMKFHNFMSCLPIFSILFIVNLVTSLPSFHAIVLLHLLHVAMFESFCAKYSHSFDRLPFGIFSVKRLMASSVCACLLFTVIRLLLLKNTNERERHKTKFTLGAGAVLDVPHEICLATR